jgi:hypothetical protein
MMGGFSNKPHTKKPAKKSAKEKIFEIVKGKRC